MAVPVKVSPVRVSPEMGKYQIDIKATLCPSVTLMYATLAEAEEAREDAVRALSKATDAVLTGDLDLPP
jgi:hypothetical protein